MPTSAAATPAFGQADLLNCEREQIHLAGSVQPHGALLLVRETDNAIIQVSDNAASFLGLDSNPIGKSLEQIPGNLAERLHPHFADPLHEIIRGVRCNVGRSRREFDCLIHRPLGGGLIIELERAGPAVELSHHLEKALQAIMAASTLRALCDETARIFRNLTSYDRVMVYRFDEEGHGEVFSEAREPTLEPFLGNRYPATDIPQIARRLYERNRVRVLRDVEYTPAALTPPLSPITGDHLDMSLCSLRSISPIHVQYLKNMGVRGTLVVSLLVNGKLWGLVSCHHYVPRFMHFEERAVCELLAEAVATRIAALESFIQAQAEFSVRRLEQQMVRVISKEGDWRNALFDRSTALLEPLGATGAALIFEGEVRTVGEVPSTAALRDIAAWLDKQPRAALVSTTAFAKDAPQFAALTPIASGLLAVPVSSVAGEYLIWLRPERIRTVTWGGNPFEPHLAGDDPLTLSPRRSFAQWHQLVEATAEPWGPADLATARMIGESVSDVVTQFRSVRALIAEDQVEQVRRQVQQSGNPVVITDPDGIILQINSAFDALLPPHTKRPSSVSDLPTLFATPEPALQEAVKNRRGWRGEVELEGRFDTPMPFLVRADPVFAPQARLLGFTLMFTDLTERKAAESARRRFQEGVIQQPRPVIGRLDSKSDLVFRNLLSTVLENAQLAALEIADGVDPAQMPNMLESIRQSVTRTAEMLGYLIWHSSSE
ncbi:GAF domain-containing protein [Rhodopila sp.]|uniref:GAF domain-containing protein n=1 Tax=Rhodopila sp. TaxID=2480087 RepID=UPI003D0B8D12